MFVEFFSYVSLCVCCRKYHLGAPSAAERNLWVADIKKLTDAFLEKAKVRNVAAAFSLFSLRLNIFTLLHVLNIFLMFVCMRICLSVPLFTRTLFPSFALCVCASPCAAAHARTCRTSEAQRSNRSWRTEGILSLSLSLSPSPSCLSAPWHATTRLVSIALRHTHTHTHANHAHLREARSILSYFSFACIDMLVTL